MIDDVDMKDKRIIKIKDLKLQKIRNEFRNLFLCWKNDVIRKMNIQRRAMLIDSEGKRISTLEMEAQTEKKFRALQETIANITAWGSNQF